ncbi:MAG TPA: Crp/Fnr family transcriptional regulator [Acidimicrobiales bacterium]|nr:Crp/Fnr family transcriptional regulator [Acidimicrobiales bacterium]
MPNPSERFTELLTEEEWDDLAALGRHRTYRKGQVIFREGQPGGTVLAIRSGVVKISVVTPTGRDILLAVKEAGSLVGELAAIDGRPRSATATALDAVGAVALPDHAFNDFLDRHPRMAVRLLRTLAAQIREAATRTADRDTGDTTSRVARRLVSLAERYGEYNGPVVEVNLPITQEDLAGWVGATREATSRSLGRLRDLGCLKTGRQRIVLLDVPALRGLATPA